MFQHVMKVWISGFILVLLAAACAPVAQAPIQDERLVNLESKVDTLSQLQYELTTIKDEVSKLSGTQAGTTDLQSRLDGLQTKVDTLAAEIESLKSANSAEETIPQTGPADDPFDVALAQYVLDTAGFHTMADGLKNTKVIDPAYLTTVIGVKKILANTRWPAALNEQTKAFTSQLDAFAAALQANNANEAADLAERVHDAQHGYSQAIDGWLNNAGSHAHE